MKWLRVILCSSLAPISALAAPVFLEDRFDLPDHFRIYRAAGPELSGGSYDLAFDGQGRLLVGDGNAVRRLKDADGDGVFDSFEVIATGLGWRGPQGLLVYGDRLYAVGGDGIQLFEGYGSAAGLTHKGRIGQPFRTGGDHDAHTILRGHDGYLYFISGDGGGTRDRLHITESNSPVVFERAASVFRISPNGQHWECVSAGGRNPPNLGQNYLGELFSFDSDMEWHVGLPWWRPVRLNHWLTGGDQGWQEVGAHPPYCIDCLPGVLEVGRGSPTWGVFYEHTQLPERYRDSFLVCDYRWKRESNDQYATTGRLVAFHLRRAGARWQATMEVLARPKPDARDDSGKPISFALVDVEVAPDGSLYISDHNQGIWRIVYGDAGRVPSRGAPLGAARDTNDLDHLLTLPQPASEWSRLAEEEIKARIGADFRNRLQSAALDRQRDRATRLRAVRLLAAEYRDLPGSFVAALARDQSPEIRGQTAWLLGLRGEANPLTALLSDPDPFVRRRAAEALARSDLAGKSVRDAIIDAMGDPERLVRYAAMAAIAHRPTSEWFSSAVARSSPQIRMRAMVAANRRRELPPESELRSAVASLLRHGDLDRENLLDLLRVLGTFREKLGSAEKTAVAEFLRAKFPNADPDVQFEQARLIGEYQVTNAFAVLLDTLERERDPVRQFHFAQALARLPGGWTSPEQDRLMAWLLKQQQGWFAEFAGKGVEFPEFWATVLADFGRHHSQALLSRQNHIDLTGLLGGVYLDLLAKKADGAGSLVELHSKTSDPRARSQIVRRLARLKRSSGEHWRAVADAFVIFDKPDVLSASAGFLAESLPDDPSWRERIGRRAIQKLDSDRSLLVPLNRLLATLSGTNAPGKVTERLEPEARERVLAFWRGWFRAKFGKDLADDSPAKPERDDAELHRLITDAKRPPGDAVRGGQIYEALQCHTCHGGGVNPGREGRIFGPDLAGVARRLSRSELADALVYPSRQVPDRFKAYELTLKNGAFLTGFITEQNERLVTFVDRDQVHQVRRENISSLNLQQTSLMPEKVLNRLSDQELFDLLAFLER